LLSPTITDQEIGGTSKLVGSSATGFNVSPWSDTFAPFQTGDQSNPLKLRAVSVPSPDGSTTKKGCAIYFNEPGVYLLQGGVTFAAALSYGWSGFPQIVGGASYVSDADMVNYSAGNVGAGTGVVLCGVIITDTETDYIWVGAEGNQFTGAPSNVAWNYTSGWLLLNKVDATVESMLRAWGAAAPGKSCCPRNIKNRGLFHLRKSMKVKTQSEQLGAARRLATAYAALGVETKKRGHMLVSVDYSGLKMSRKYEDLKDHKEPICDSGASTPGVMVPAAEPRLTESTLGAVASALSALVNKPTVSTRSQGAAGAGSSVVKKPTATTASG